MPALNEAAIPVLAIGLGALVALAHQQASADSPPPPWRPSMNIIPYTVIHPGEPAGDRLDEPRRLAAAVVAQDSSPPRLVVDIGSDTGEFLEAFMQQFPNAKGQWTEPVTIHRPDAVRRLARFAPRVSYVIGCPSRDISLGCVPKGTDVMITSWLQVHQGLPGIQKFYQEAFLLLPSGGWVANIDHVRSDAPGWNDRLSGARKTGAGEGLNAVAESPPVHRTDPVMPTLADQQAALKGAGFTNVTLVWSRLDTVLLMAKKP